MPRCVGDGEASDEALHPVDADVVLVAKHRHQDLLRSLALCSLRWRRLPATLEGPAAVAVDLAGAGRFPVGGGAAVAQGLLFLVAQPRAAGFHNRRIDDLPAHRQIAVLTQHRAEPREGAGKGATAGQLLAVEPDRLGVRHRIVQRQADEAHEGEPVAQLISGLVVGQGVERLQDQHPEHQHRVIGWASAP
jgi:hypothetical protein